MTNRSVLYEFNIDLNTVEPTGISGILCEKNNASNAKAVTTAIDACRATRRAAGDFWRGERCREAPKECLVRDSSPVPDLSSTVRRLHSHFFRRKYNHNPIVVTAISSRDQKEPMRKSSSGKNLKFCP